jgi:outer membrane protein assembly factor BamA
LSAGYRYDIAEGTGEVHADLSYQGWYPIINAGIAYGRREDESTLSLSAADRRRVAFEWDETTVTGGVSVPLLLTRSKYLTTLTVSNSIGLTLTSSFNSRVTRNGILIEEGVDRYVPANDTLFFLYSDITDFGQLISNHFEMSYSHALKQSRRDFNPKFGQFLSFESYSAPFGGDYQGWQWTVNGTFFFPGLFKHHSLYLYGGYQESLESFDLDVYTFRNQLFKPRGYSYPQNTKFTSLSANYVFPVWYPDIAIGPVINIQRVKLNLFYDYGEGEGNDYYYNFDTGRVYISGSGAIYQSAGAELTFDVNFFRTLPQFELGLRTARIESNNFNDGGWVFEFIIGNIPF